MSDDHLVKKTDRPRRYKQPILNSRHIEIFPMGLTHDFGPRMEILSLFMDRLGLEKMFNDQWDRKQALLD